MPLPFLRLDKASPSPSSTGSGASESKYAMTR
jgi:hypothetical protein